jgi:predicted amidohydrolase
MEPIRVACVQQRMKFAETPEEFAAEARRFLYQAQAKAAQLVVFPELSGLMLAPSLISGVKRGLVKREARGKQPGAGLLSQSVGRMAGSTAGAMGGGFRGSLARMVRKNSDDFYDLYVKTFGSLARQYETAILGGSLYLYDPETASVRHRSYLFDIDGAVLGYSEKLNLGYAEKELAQPGSDLPVLDTRFGRVGVLIGQDIMYPELARLLAIQGADLLIGIAAAAGPAAGSAIRSALSLRAEENQVFAAASFLIGPNLLGQENVQDYCGQSALLAPISLTVRGDGLLIQTGTDRTEGIIAAELDMDGLYDLRQTSRFRPRQKINLGNLGPVLAEMYEQGLGIDEALEQHIVSPAEPVLEPVEIEAEPVPEPVEIEAEPPASVRPEPLPEPAIEEPPAPPALESPAERESSPVSESPSVPEAMSITSFRKVEK